jgi:glycosyltransferase involved in cell wall biosynthesis
MKPVFINGSFLSRPITGVERYALEMLKAVDAQHPTGYVLLTPGRITCAPLANVEVRPVGKLTGKLWEQFELPLHSRGGVLFSPFPAAPLFKRHHVVTIHDAVLWVYPRAYSFAFRTWYRLFIPVLASAAEKIVTVSQFSSKELQARCHLRSSKMEIIPNGHDHIIGVASDPSILARMGIGRRFVLAVGSANPNKNVRGLIKAFQLLADPTLDLVVVGAPNQKVFGDLDVGHMGKWTGYITDAQLKALYEAASCFVQASFYEGFGLPPLEALACGCPVVSSHAGSLPEVLGDAALYCDPSSPEDIADKIRMALLSGNFQKRARAVLTRFHWTASAIRLMEVLDSARQ